MDHAHHSLGRIFKSSKSSSIDDELAVLQESIRSSSFTLVPSALTPSRTPCNTAISSSRTLSLKGPVHLDFSSGWEKGSVTDWYNCHKTKGSTVIDKIQLRKSHQHPYYHEYITVSTRGNHTYRIDRRPDAKAPFDTIMKSGCTAYDTIEEVHSTSELKELYRTSGCVVELHWGCEQTIDLLFILSICFAIHNDKWAKRYTLQRYNCYFLSWTIIIVTMRKSAVCGDGLNMAVQAGIRQRGGNPIRNVAKEVGRWWWQWMRERNRERKLERGWWQQSRDLQRKELLPNLELERVQKQVLYLRSERALELEQELKLSLELKLEMEQAHDKQMQEQRYPRDSVGLWEWQPKWQQQSKWQRLRERAQARAAGRAGELRLELDRELEHEGELKWEQELVLKLEKDLVWGLEWELTRAQQRLMVREQEWPQSQLEKKRMRMQKSLDMETEWRERRLKQKQKLELEPEPELLLGVAHGLGQIPLVLGWGLAQNWIRGIEDDNNTVFLPDRSDTLVIQNRKVFRAVVGYMEEYATGDRYSIARDLADFPAALSVLINDEPGPVISKKPEHQVCKPAELEKYLIDTVTESHAARIARWGLLGSKEEVKSDVLTGILRTWQAVSQLSENMIGG